jgi:GT2 family glycosyltransferase
VDYSIVIPVFNREDLTRQCLATLPPTLAGAGDGETIVVDNGSDPATAAVLAEFPWVRVIRNERNLGFAAACNAGARAARGRIVVHLNNDTVAKPGWLATMLAHFADPTVGIVGARLYFPDGTLQHAGVVSFAQRLSPDGFGPYHLMWKFPGATASAARRRDFDVVTGACLAVPRDLFLELGGFATVYWNGYEDVDFCLQVRALGRRVVYEPAAELTHFESQSGVQRKRRLLHNVRELAARWAQRVAPDDNAHCDAIGRVRRELLIENLRTAFYLPIPPITVIVHGPAPPDAAAFRRSLDADGLALETVVWCAEGPTPARSVARSWADALSSATDGGRGERYVVVVDTRTRLGPRWLHELINAVEYASDVCAATALPGEEWDHLAMPMSVDPRCALVSLRAIPLHVQPDRSFDSLAGAVVDWIDRCVALGLSLRAVLREGIALGPALGDATYRARAGRTIEQARRPDPVRLEALEGPDPRFAPFASIVTLSWNAPHHTELAVASIRERTRTPYEIIIVDNGSNPEALERVRALAGPDVRIIENDRNYGFAYGCNQGMAAARGTHVVLLNNDVIVTDGWLEALLDAHRRDPLVGISAPRSNSVAGHQQIADGNYADLTQMIAFARERSRRERGIVYATDRVIGFCMCISRAAIASVGGIDTRYGIGNFEDDDYCVRVRAAGYRIVVCEDAFIHHFGSVSFKANNVDYGATMLANWKIFAERWGLPAAYPTNGYHARAAIERGFVRSLHYVALPAARPAPAAAGKPRYELALHAFVADERDWNRVAPLVNNFLKAFEAGQPVRLAIGVGGELDALTIGRRIVKAAERSGLEDERAPDIDVVDAGEATDWALGFGAARIIAVGDLTERSPSGLRRLLGAAVER